jgi:hypothetical protein
MDLSDPGLFYFSTVKYWGLAGVLTYSPRRCPEGIALRSIGLTKVFILMERVYSVVTDIPIVAVN